MLSYGRFVVLYIVAEGVRETLLHVFVFRRRTCTSPTGHAAPVFRTYPAFRDPIPNQAGFLGSLTTMSTFVSEVVGHRDRHTPSASYAYLAATAIAAQAPVLIVGATLK